MSTAVASARFYAQSHHVQKNSTKNSTFLATKKNKLSSQNVTPPASLISCSISMGFKTDGGVCQPWISLKQNPAKLWFWTAFHLKQGTQWPWPKSHSPIYMQLCKNIVLLNRDKRETFPYFVPMISVLLCIFVKGSQSIKNNFDIFLLKSFKNSS